MLSIRTTDSESRSLSVAQIVFLLILGALIGAITGLFQARGRGLLVAAVGWAYLRLYISKETQDSHRERLRSFAAYIFFTFLITIAIALLLNIWRQGWQSFWDRVKSTNGIFLLEWVALDLTILLGLSLVVSVLLSAFNALGHAINGDRPLEARSILRAARIFLSEATLLGLFILILLGDSLSDKLAGLSLKNLPVTVLWGAGVGLVAPVLALSEDTDEEPASYTRLLMCVLVVAVHYKTAAAIVIGSHDSLISDVLVGAQADLGVLLPVILLISSAILFLALLSINLLWRPVFLNLVAYKLASICVYLDESGRVHTLLRHIGHLIAHRYSPVHWLWKGFLLIWQLLMGKVPAYLKSKNIEPLDHRYGQLVQARLVEAAHNTTQSINKWRASRLTSSDATISETISAMARKNARALLAVGDHLACPHYPCRSDSNNSKLWNDEMENSPLWRFIKGADVFLLMTRPLFVGESDTGYKNRIIRKVIKRQTGYYKRVQLLPISESFRAMIDYRIEALSEKSFDDVELLTWRDQLVTWLKDKPEWSALAVHIFLSELGLTRDCAGLKDCAGLIESCRLLTIEADYGLSIFDHTDLGEAYWFYASELGEGVFGQWAREKSINHFYAAQAIEHLNKLTLVP